MSYDLHRVRASPWHGASPRARCAAAAVALACALAGCAPPVPEALGTLEADRIVLPSPAAERIVAIDVREGETVSEGQPLLRLDDTRVRAEALALEAEVQRRRDLLAELEAGPRRESIELARANLAAFEAEARRARAYRDRLAPLAGKHYVAAADLDRARAAVGQADGQANAARAALAELEQGTRREQIAQAVAALATAEAQLAAQRSVSAKYAVTAPRAGHIDSIPYKLGDQAPVGAPLAILLIGDAPYARVYVPEPMRAARAIGESVAVVIGDRRYAGYLRMIRSEPVFTPYYALAGDDAARLSYLAEIALSAEAARLPVGLPVRAEFGAPTP